MPRRPRVPRRADVTPGRIVLAGVAAVVVLSGTHDPTPPTWSVLPPADTGVLGATGTPPDDPGSATVPPDPLPGPGGSSGPGAGSDGPQVGIPSTVLAAYRAAEAELATAAPGCHLPWALVAGIGRIESSHARNGAVTADGTTRGAILGPRLDGSGGNVAIHDTDRGTWDHDTVWDRAVGPTQFIPSTWRAYGVDGNDDGRVDPGNVFDAATATGRYLCAGGLDVATTAGQHDAVFRYNHSEAYVRRVLAWARAYGAGDPVPTPDSSGSAATPSDGGSSSLADGSSGSSGSSGSISAAGSSTAAASVVRVPAPVVVPGPAVVAAAPVVVPVPAPVVPPPVVPPAAPLPPSPATTASVPPSGTSTVASPSAVPQPAPPVPARTTTTPAPTTPAPTTAASAPNSAPTAASSPSAAPRSTSRATVRPPATPAVPRTTAAAPGTVAPRPSAARSAPRTTTSRTSTAPAVDPAALCTAAAPRAEVAARVAPARLLRVRSEVVGDVVRCTAVTSTGTVLVATVHAR